MCRDLKTTSRQLNDKNNYLERVLVTKNGEPLFWLFSADLKTETLNNEALELIGKVFEGYDMQPMRLHLLGQDVGKCENTLDELAIVFSDQFKSTPYVGENEGVERQDESARFTRLKGATLVLMNGDYNAAITWLKTPLSILRNKTPLEHAQTEHCVRDVEELVGRLQHWIFSE
jgi:hypothetical protein